MSTFQVSFTTIKIPTSLLGQVQDMMQAWAFEQMQHSTESPDAWQNSLGREIEDSQSSPAREIHAPSPPTSDESSVVIKGVQTHAEVSLMIPDDAMSCLPSPPGSPRAPVSSSMTEASVDRSDVPYSMLRPEENSSTLSLPPAQSPDRASPVTTAKSEPLSDDSPVEHIGRDSRRFDDAHEEAKYRLDPTRKFGISLVIQAAMRSMGPGLHSAEKWESFLRGFNSKYEISQLCIVSRKSPCFRFPYLLRVESWLGRQVESGLGPQVESQLDRQVEYQLNPIFFEVPIQPSLYSFASAAEEAAFRLNPNNVENCRLHAFLQEVYHTHGQSYVDHKTLKALGKKVGFVYFSMRRMLTVSDDKPGNNGVFFPFMLRKPKSPNKYRLHPQFFAT